jgi:bifunctional non-homologous end joining protein LigD
VESALRNKSSRFVIDGEAVLLGVDGVSDFDGLHSRKHDDEVQLYTFDILALDCDDLRALPLPLSMRKANLARPDGIFQAPSSKARSVPTYSGKPASSGLRDLFQHIGGEPIGPGRRRTGSS